MNNASLAPPSDSNGSSASGLPSFEDIRAAAARIAPFARVTPVWRSAALDALTGAQLHFKCENLQHGGAFKFRGACNAVWTLDDAQAAHGVVTHSSGNHGTALALAAASRGITAHVVVPEGAVRAKLALIERAGAVLHRCAPTITAREETAAALQRKLGAVLVHPYADAPVIAGQGTLALELLRQAGPLDALFTPVGGGGLIAGIAIAAHALQPSLMVHGAEPQGADDAARSLASGDHQLDFTPDTLCDGLRGTLGAPNFTALRTHHVTITTVSDAECIAAMKLLWSELKLLVELSSATVLAAVIQQRERFAGQRIGVVLTGGNVDLDTLPW